MSCLAWSRNGRRLVVGSGCGGNLCWTDLASGPGAAQGEAGEGGGDDDDGGRPLCDPTDPDAHPGFGQECVTLPGASAATFCAPHRK